MALLVSKRGEEGDRGGNRKSRRCSHYLFRSRNKGKAGDHICSPREKRRTGARKRKEINNNNLILLKYMRSAEEKVYAPFSCLSLGEGLRERKRVSVRDISLPALGSCPPLSE